MQTYGLGGQNAHPLEFAGPEIEPTPSGANGATFWLEESSESGSTQPAANWASHPSAIGYRRAAIQSSSGSGSGGGSSGSGGSTTIPGNYPLMDSGTSDGSNSDEAGRLANFDSGGNENITGPQAAPTPRAEQDSTNLYDPASPIPIVQGGSLPALLDMNPGQLQTPQLILPDNGSMPDNGASADLLERPSDSPTVDPALLACGAVGYGGPAGPLRRVSPASTGGAGGTGFNPLDLSTYGPALQALGQDAANQLGSLYRGAKQELALLPGTMAALPGAVGDSFSTGRSADSVMGLAQNSKLMQGLNPALALMPKGPIFGNQDAYDMGANQVAPLADEAAIQATAGKILGVLGCLGKGVPGLAGVLGRAVGNGARLGFGAGGVVNGAQGLSNALANGDSVGALKGAMSLLGGLGNLFGLFGGSCFAAGTPILTPEGSKPVEEIQSGDWVLAAPDDDPEAEPEPRLVEATFQNYAPLTLLRVGRQTIQTTPQHPFWVRGRGWLEAQQLMAGDELRCADGRWIVVQEVMAGAPAPVYNMCVAEYHTYFVGSPLWGFAVWAHNASLVCANRRSSRGPTHGYGILDLDSGEPFKVGISSGKINQAGESYRAVSQVNKLNRAGGNFGSVLFRTLPNRARGLDWEYDMVKTFRVLGHKLPGNIRPGVNPLARP